MIQEPIKQNILVHALISPKEVIKSSLHFFFIKQNLSGNLQSVLSQCIEQKHYETQ